MHGFFGYFFTSQSYLALFSLADEIEAEIMCVTVKQELKSHYVVLPCSFPLSM
jgi:hypothetical protein